MVEPTRRPQVEVFMATSLDGFIARPDGGLDWLLQRHAAAPAGEDFGYAAFMAGVDALLMGRKTFEAAQHFSPWPYAGTPVHVLTRQPAWAPPPALHGQVQAQAIDPLVLLQRLHAQGVHRVYLDGGELIRHLLAADAVDALTLTTIPVLLGQGRPLWGPLPADLAWRLGAVRHWDCGFVQCRWERGHDLLAVSKAPKAG